MTDTIKQEKKIDAKTLERIKKRVDVLVDNGSSVDHAISVVCKVNEFNPTTVRKLLNTKFNIEKNVEEEDYKDIKNDEGSYVMLKKNPGKTYEIININNKENITLMDLDNDSEVKVKEEDIIPIVTETKMKELNEAQYTVSIDNLETTDAETLSQMLSLAGQAEEPVAEEIPMDAGIPGEVPAVDPVMDYEPTIPSTMDGPGFEAAEIDGMEEPAIEEPVVDDMPVVDAEEDVVLPAEEEIDVEASVPAEEDEIIGESVEEEISEDVLVPKSEEKEKSDATTAEDKQIAEKEEDVPGEARSIIQNLVIKNHGDKEAIHQEVFGLHEQGNISDAALDYIITNFDELVSDEGEYKYSPEEEEELKADVEAEKRMDAKDIEGEYEYDEPKEESVEEPVEETVEESADFDAEIAETLRIAGVQLDEVSEEDANKGKKDLPVPPIGKANPAKTEEVAPEQAPDWNEVSTEDAMGYDSSLGKEPVLNIKETVNKGKIESIMETATRMYAKKDSADWLALDRRYVEKLMLEGVSYSNASKMLMKAKAGK